MSYEEYLKVIADVVGWIYSILWFSSSIPQIYTNWRRKSSVGLSYDTMVFFTFGGSTYAAYTLAVYLDKALQEELLEHSKQSSPVKLTDVVYAVVTLILIWITNIQIFVYEKGSQRVSRHCIVISVLLSIAMATSCVLSQQKFYSWIVTLEFCGYIKSAFSMLMYIPQVWLNFRRKCTEGFAIGGVLLDFSGGLLSILQQDIYCVIEHSNKQLTANLPKLVLGGVTLVFDIIQILQHYLFYRGNRAPGYAKITVLVGDDCSGSQEVVNPNYETD